jgi:stearoyl-CoA desaturase (delta-9 desaturase)
MHYEHRVAIKNESWQQQFTNALKQVVFFLIHAAVLLVFVVGFSWIAIVVCLALYFVRMFAITGAFHRYFSHRTYKTSRAFQFFLGFLGTTAAQKGPLWWASHHRHHHAHSDTEEDMHSAKVHGVWFSHVGWILCSHFIEPRLELVKDLTRYPELCWLDKYNLLPPILLAAGTYILGEVCNFYWPWLGTDGLQMLVWGFFVSTVLLYHGTFAINSVAHLVGKKRFNTGDESRNSLALAIITLGEGWHNNHHRYPGSERQGFYWWEIDITHYILKTLSLFGLVWDLREPPERIYLEAKK